jgi:cytochrome c oxidase subunit 4
MQETVAVAEVKMEHPNYIGVWWWLLGLTVLEIGALYLPISKFVQVVALVLLAITKALLVAAYFMHLKFERVLLIGIVLYPLALAITLTVLTMLSMYRF